MPVQRGDDVSDDGERPVFGLHVGATSMCVAMCCSSATAAGGGDVRVLANENGERVTGTALRLIDNECVVGTAARDASSRHSDVTITHAPAYISAADRQAAAQSLSEHDDECAPLFGGVGRFCRRRAAFVLSSSAAAADGSSGSRGHCHTVVPIQRAITHLLQHLHSIAVAQLAVSASCAGSGRSARPVNAVISVPAHWTQSERDLMRTAAEQAGFSVLQLIDWPAAAVTALRLQHELPTDSQCLLVRLGGSSAGAAVVHFSDTGLVHMTALQHRASLGGQRLTDALCRHLVRQLGAGGETAAAAALSGMSRRARARLNAVAERAKCVLTRAATADCFCESLVDGRDLNCQVSQARWHALLTARDGVLSAWTQLARDTMSQAVADAPVTHVVMCGGAAWSPLVGEHIARALNDGVRLLPLHQHAPDELLAAGAALHASLLSTTAGGGVDACRPRVPVSRRAVCVKFGAETAWRSLIPAGAVLPALGSLQHVTAAAVAGGVNGDCYSSSSQQLTNCLIVHVRLASLQQQQAQSDGDGIDKEEEEEERCVALPPLSVTCGERVVAAAMLDARAAQLVVKVAAERSNTRHQLVISCL